MRLNGKLKKYEGKGITKLEPVATGDNTGATVENYKISDIMVVNQEEVDEESGTNDIIKPDSSRLPDDSSNSDDSDNSGNSSKSSRSRPYSVEVLLFVVGAVVEALEVHAR